MARRRLSAHGCPMSKLWFLGFAAASAHWAGAGTSPAAPAAVYAHRSPQQRAAQVAADLRCGCARCCCCETSLTKASASGRALLRRRHAASTHRCHPAPPHIASSTSLPTPSLHHPPFRSCTHPQLFPSRPSLHPQPLLRMRRADSAESGGHVRKLHPHTHRHHRGHPQAGHAVLLPLLRTLPQPAQHLAGMSGCCLQQGRRPSAHRPCPPLSSLYPSTAM